jgi:fructosamine-3-kinase
LKPVKLSTSATPQAVQDWLEEQGHGAVVSAEPVAGGCISNGVRLETGQGGRFFLKTNSQTPKDMFKREAEGLEALRAADSPRVPQAYLHGPDFLLLEDLAPAGRNKDYWTTFGKQLAALHNHTNERFGFDHDNYIGSTPQPNTWLEDGFAFFAEHRLGFQAELAEKAGLLSNSEVSQVERIEARLEDLIPAQPASLLHGDLWGGNAIADENGQPALIDPAAHYGWGEAELGMTALFGGFSAEFYAAYEEVRPLETSYRERFPLYNLYHLLNHLNLFGGGYHGQVKTILDRYA